METSDTVDTILPAYESWFAKYKNVPEFPDNIFRGVIDRFDGVTVDSNMEECDDTQFEAKLKDSLAYWQASNRRGVWFKVHLRSAGWVPVLAKHNFDFHHAKEGFVMMCTWLANEPMGIPPYAHTMVGVGAVVVNDKQQVLVVSERNAFVTNSWKLPGGYLERKEDIIDAGIREIQEETNIQTTFETLLAIGHTHGGGGFGCSGLYIVMALNPLTTELTNCEQDIGKCVWMDIDKFLQHPNVPEINRIFMRLYLKYKKNGVKIINREENLKKKYKIFEIEPNLSTSQDTNVIKIEFEEGEIDIQPITREDTLEPKKLFKCSFCDKTFPNNFNKLRHEKQLHALSYYESEKEISKLKCDFCEKHFSNNFNKTRHMKTAHADLHISCEDESKSHHPFDRINLISHPDESQVTLAKKIEQPEDENDSLSETDGSDDTVLSEKSGTKRKLRTKQAIKRAKNKRFKCEFCEKKFGRNFNRIRHEKKLHPDLYVERPENWT